MTAWFIERGPGGLDRRSPVPVPTTHALGGMQSFLRRMRLEMGLAMRYEQELFLVYLVVEDSRDETLESFSDQVLRCAQRTLRATDGVYEFRQHQFAVVLPGASAEGAFVVAAEFADELLPRLPAALQARFGTQVFAAQGGKSEMNHLLDLLLEADDEPVAQEQS
jgi:hypothetical protein